MHNFSDLAERDLLALAISSEEEDGRVYADFAHDLREDYPGSAQMFADMAAEENEHRRRLIDPYAEPSMMSKASPLTTRISVSSMSLAI